MTVFDVLTMLCGLAFFLFGMSFMGEELKNVAGNKMESILWRLSSTPIKGLLLGTFATAVIQSSSATTVMVVSFVNAGMMKVSQAITVIMGAEIGTTMTGWLLTLANISGESGLSRLFSTSTFLPVVAVIGIALRMFGRKKTARHTGGILLGFSVLMYGMMIMSQTVTPLKEDPNFVGILTLFSNPILGILAGTLLTVVIQSCSAGVGILQALSVTGVLSYAECIPLILGMNLGASTPILIAMMGSNKNGKRAAIAYLVCNILGIIIVAVLYYPLRALLGLSVFDAVANTVGIATLNTVMRVLVMMILLPAHKGVEKIVYSIVKYRADEDADEEDLKKLNDRALRSPQAAVALSESAVYKMADIAEGSIYQAFDLFRNYDKNGSQILVGKENLLDKYEGKLGEFVLKILHGEVHPDQQPVAEKVLNAIGEFERLGDHMLNIVELADEVYEKKLEFSPEADRELGVLESAIRDVLGMAVESFKTNNRELALRVEPLEEVIDMMCDEMKVRHVTRLQNGICNVISGFVFNDLLTNCERISDHCSNIAICALRASGINTLPHEYAENANQTESYAEAFKEYSDKYLMNLRNENLSGQN
ncbi:MAG: Na/Pi cotransporter family protein [Oscillospiraceae bacterium]|nr:Na/Pi cotransporter family protein [Oscillospiraceae bacterium]